jgi:hypothetical protein
LCEGIDAYIKADNFLHLFSFFHGRIVVGGKKSPLSHYMSSYKCFIDEGERTSCKEREREMDRDDFLGKDF